MSQPRQYDMLPRRQLPTMMFNNGFTSTYRPSRTPPNVVQDATAGLTPIGVNRFLTPEGVVVRRTPDGFIDTQSGLPVDDLVYRGEPNQVDDLVYRGESMTPEMLQGQTSNEYYGGGGTFEAYRASDEFRERETDERLNRWYGDWITAGAGISGTGTPEQNEQAYNEFMGQSVWGHPDDHVTNNWRAQPGGAILEIAAAGQDVRGMLNRAILMSQEDEDAYVRLQVQLWEHGYLEEPPTWGVWTANEAQAIAGIIDKKHRWGSDKSLTEMLAEDRALYAGSSELSEAGLDALRSEDEEAAEELERLREVIENFELSLELESADYLREVMQVESVNTLGRRLNDQEVDALVAQVHDRQREDFYANDPGVRAYNEAVRKYEDAVTADEERRAGAISGAGASSVDQFLRAVAQMESGNNPNAYNPDSAAMGTFQFIPGTWNQVTRAAGLNPNDKSEANQWAAARYHAADIYSRTGNWYDVFISWYAGEGALNYSSQTLNAQQWGQNTGREYPSIYAYADRGMSIMNGFMGTTDPSDPMVPENVPFSGLINWATNLAADVGEAVARGDIDPNDKSTWKLDPSKSTLGGTRGDIGSVSDFNPGGPSVHEYQRFDPVAYLASAVGESGGPEADAWNYALNASAFFDSLGRR